MGFKRINLKRKRKALKAKRLDFSTHVKGSVDKPYSQIASYMRMIADYKDQFVIIADDRLIYGHKNIYCPQYEKCLEKACKDDMRWVCNGCKYEFTFEKQAESQPKGDYYEYESIVGAIGLHDSG